MTDYWIPGASRKQDFSDAYTGARITPRIIVLHTTEGSSWPSYSGGKSAPHFTMSGSDVRQHFPVNRAARALKNAAGGVETNTSGAIQIEIIGTCDPRSTVKPLVTRLGTDGLSGLLAVLAWLRDEHGVTLADAAPRGWVAYPDSYGLKARQRMTGDEWQKARGIVGHQHVPENDHGDPGSLNLKPILAALAPTPTPSPERDRPMIYLSGKPTVAIYAHNGGWVIIGHGSEEYKNLVAAGVPAVWVDASTISNLIADARGNANSALLDAVQALVEKESAK